MTWEQKAISIISKVHSNIRANASFDERKKAVQEAYPWGCRSGWPYKAWLKAQRRYLARYAPKGEVTKKLPLTPLERMIKKTIQAEKLGKTNGRA